MKVICAGFPKTGTKSLALALRHLGYSVHDYEEHLQYNLDHYLDYFQGRTDSSLLVEKYQVKVIISDTSVTYSGLL